MTLEFTIPAPPAGKERPRFDSRSNRTYTPRKTRDYEELVLWSYRSKYGSRQLAGTINAAIAAYFAIPASWSKARKERAIRGEINPTSKPDADNIAKAVLDALNGAAYRDDAAVARLTVTKHYSLHPRVEVILQEVRGPASTDGPSFAVSENCPIRGKNEGKDGYAAN
jgi:Holliday junction resolvase RusA-like endonuclease